MFIGMLGTESSEKWFQQKLWNFMEFIFSTFFAKLLWVPDF